MEFTSESVGPGTFFFGRLLITDSISLIAIDLFRLSVSSCVSFDRLCLPRNWFNSSRLSNLRA